MSRAGRGRKAPPSPKLAAFLRSPEFKAAAARGREKSLAVRAAARRCGAKARSTGEPCRALPLANGRCRHHGGRTPRDSHWHVVQIERPRSKTALAKLDRKLAKRDAETRAREKRLQQMSPEERQRYDEWQRTHRPGPSGKRATARSERAQAEWLRSVLQQAPCADGVVDVFS